MDYSLILSIVLSGFLKNGVVEDKNDVQIWETFFIISVTMEIDHIP